MDEQNNGYQTEYHTFHFESETPEPVQQPPVAAPKAPKAKKPRGGAWKLVAVALVCALLGGAGGGALVGHMMQQDAAQTPPAQSESVQQPAQTEPEEKTPAVSSVSSSTGGMTPAQVFQKNVQAVVGITNSETTTNFWGQPTSTASTGTGFIISDDGYIVTNYHVIADATSLTVSLNDGSEYEAQVVGYESANDVALLKIDASGLTTVELGDSDALSVGDQVLAIGNPLGELTYTMTVGYVSALEREINADGTPINMLQTDAAINPGNSGGPLFDMAGNVIGITTAKYGGETASGATVEGIGFAIPINDVKKIITDLKDFGYVTNQAYLGVQVREIDTSIAQMYQLPAGVYVDAVEAGSCSEAAGLQSGDIITALGDETVESYLELTAALRKQESGDQTTITVYRSGETLTLQITLDEKPQTTEEAAAEPEQSEVEQPFGGTQEQTIDPFEYFFGR